MWNWSGLRKSNVTSEAIETIATQILLYIQGGQMKNWQQLLFNFELTR